MRKQCLSFALVLLVASAAWAVPHIPVVGHTADSESTYPPDGWINTYNDSGMLDEDNHVSDIGGTSGYSNGFLGTIEYDLGQNYLLDTIRIWNLKRAGVYGGTDRGFNERVIRVRADGDPVPYDVWVGSVPMAAALPANAPAPVDLELFNIQADADVIGLGGGIRYIQVTTTGALNHAHWPDCGLSEIRFYEIPEPATLALLSIGGLFLRRRKA